MPHSWPAASYEQWRATCDTLHAHTQVLGKLAAGLAPPEPQLQHAALRLTARGWETAPLPAPDGSGSLVVALDDNFRMIEEGTSGFGDKKADIATVDDLDLINYTLKDFTVKSLGARSALVTYEAHYESKYKGQTAKADSIFGEVWTREGSDNDWKALYLQETYIQEAAAK